MRIEDCVHENLILPDYCGEIIRTREFQRLRKLKQLGVSHYIFDNAKHTRFEHCIGTAFLCQQILETIERNSEIIIADLHKKSVILAGLLHDLGHGPMSHLWESAVRSGNTNKQWTHEDQSQLMIKHMLSENNIKLDTDEEQHQIAIDLINSFITGDCETWQRHLKPSEMFLSEIVSNKLCNVDVDKCDYLLRDYFYCKKDIQPFIDFLDRARVVYDDNGVSHVGFHADDFKFIENMFKNRAKYHLEVYQVPQLCGIEKLLLDIFHLADNAGFKIAGYSITEIQEHPSAFIHLNDSVLDLIRSSSIDNPKMAEAKELIRNLDTGKFYQFIYESPDDVTPLYDLLVKKFGESFFCKVKRVIPNAKISSQIPLYIDNGTTVNKTSKCNLMYESTMIFCKTVDSVVLKNVINFLNNNNNNNNNINL